MHQIISYYHIIFTFIVNHDIIFNSKVLEVYMNHIQLEEMNLSEIVLGTDGYGERISEKTAYNIMDTYILNGGNVIDTARMYTNGESERIVGQYINNNKLREKIYISTKCSHPPLNDMTRYFG